MSTRRRRHPEPGPVPEHELRTTPRPAPESAGEGSRSRVVSVLVFTEADDHEAAKTLVRCLEATRMFTIRGRVVLRSSPDLDDMRLVARHGVVEPFVLLVLDGHEPLLRLSYFPTMQELCGWLMPLADSGRIR